MTCQVAQSRHCSMGGAGQQALDPLEEGGLIVDDVADCLGGDPGCRQPGVQVQARVGVGQIVERRGVERCPRIASAHLVPVVAGDLCLQVDDAVCPGLGLVQPGQSEHAGHVGLVRRANLGLVVVAVVGLVGQAQTALSHPGDVVGRIGGIGLVLQVEQPAHALTVLGAQDCHEIGGVGEGVDLGQVRTQRCGAGGVHGVDVHEPPVQFGHDLDLVIGGLWCQSAQLRGPTGAQIRQDLVDGSLGIVTQHPERSGARLIRGDLGHTLPGAVDVLVQVIAGTDVLVAVGEGFCHGPTLVDLATREASSGMDPFMPCHAPKNKRTLRIAVSQHHMATEPASATTASKLIFGTSELSSWGMFPLATPRDHPAGGNMIRGTR